MKLIKTNETHITALLFAVVMCFSLVAVKSAAAQTDQAVDVAATDVNQEADVSNGGSNNEDLSEERKAMLEQIRSLRELVAERRGQLQEQRQDRREDRREQFQIDREEFMASLEGLSPEEKKAAMMEFISDLQEHIAEKRAEAQAVVQEVRETVQENRSDFRSDLEGLTAEERIAAIMERVAEIREQIEDRMNADLDDEEPVDDDEEEEEEEEEPVDDDEEVYVNQDLQVMRDCFFVETLVSPAASCVEADLNEDGVVNAADLGLLRSAEVYDLSGDEIVDLSDTGADVMELQDCFFTDVAVGGPCVDSDLNEDGVVNAGDLGELKSSEVYDLNNDGVVDLRDDSIDFPEES